MKQNSRFYVLFTAAIVLYLLCQYSVFSQEKTDTDLITGQEYTLVMKDGRVLEGKVVSKNAHTVKIQSDVGITTLDREKIMSFTPKEKVDVRSYYKSKVKIFLKDGQIYEGKVSYEDSNAIRLEGEYGSPTIIDRDQILSVEEEEPLSYLARADGASSGENFYQSQVKILNEQIKLYKNEIELMETDLNEVEEKYTKKEKELKNRIKELESELAKKDEKVSQEKFPQLIVINPGKEIVVNKEYISSVLFRVSEGLDGYFVGAEYTLYSEFVDVIPKFEVYFYNAQGLNIGIDRVDEKYMSIPKGKPEKIMRGVTLTIANERPKYFYLKMIKE